MKKIVLIILIIFPLVSFSARIRDIEFSIDSSSFGIDNYFKISVNLIKKNGKRIHLEPNVFAFQWSKVNVIGENILSFSNGVVYFNQTNINRNNYKTKIVVSYNLGRKGKHTLEQTINLPFVTEISLKNEHVKVNKAENIQYLLKFNNGKSTIAKRSLFDFEDINLNSDSNLIATKYKIHFELTDPSDKDSILIIGKLKEEKEILFTQKLPLLYSNVTQINGNGRDGANGNNGTNGRKYSQNGTNAFAGKNGSNANDIKIFIDIINKNNKVFFKINSVFSNQPNQFDLIEFKGLPIEIFANGGNGGNGGSGGNGRDGKINLDKKIISPNGGNGGNAGNGGNGGNGGKIIIYFRKIEKDYSHYFIPFNFAGKKGTSGTPGKEGRGDYVNSSKKDKKARILDGKEGLRGKNGRDGKNGATIKKVFLSEVEFQKILMDNLK